MNETQLIEGCKQHNPKAQKALYDTYARKMMSVCLRYGSNRETAEDLLQECSGCCKSRKQTPDADYR
mgnify:CR=1 FL=1